MVRPRGRQSRRNSILVLSVSVLIAILSLFSVVRTYAMPVEARTTEAWYSYQSSVGFGFQAHVQKGRFYPTTPVTPAQLIKVRGPNEPPTYKRVLISRFTDSIEIEVPYRFKADRPADLTVKWRVEGMEVIPGIWQLPYPLLAEKSWSVNAAEVSGTEKFVIPATVILAEMVDSRTTYQVQAEPIELHIKPVLEITASGLKEPVQVTTTGDFLVTFRSTTVEVDDARTVTGEKGFSETKIVPITVPVFGRQIQVSTIRQVSIGAFVFFILAAVVTAWARREKPDVRTLLQKLGSNLIVARSFEVPADASVVEIRTANELLHLQVQAERPVIRVGSTYFLQDGSTCYRLSVSEAETTATDE